MTSSNVLKIISLEPPDWFDYHQEEKYAFEIINFMKHKLIPGFVKLLKKYRVLIETQNDNDYEELSKINEDMINILSQFNQNFTLNEKFVEEMNGHLDQVFFKKKNEAKKWLKIFSACELCSVSLLSGMINYLDQSSRVIIENGNLEIEECVYFFISNLDSSLRKHYHQIRQLIWIESFQSSVYSYFCGPFLNPVLCLIEKMIPIPKLHLQVLRTTCLEIMEGLIKKQRYLKKYDQTMQSLLFDQRSSLLLSRARLIAKQFITKFLESVTSTLIQFWITILDLSETDALELNHLDDLLRSIATEVSASYHQFVLFSNQKLRPYGFIIKAVLQDLSEKDKSRTKDIEEMRSELRECFSIYIIWLFEFITKYPSSLPLRLDGLSWASNFYQSMIESLTDFKALYRLSQVLTQLIASSDKRKLLDECDYGPWKLLDKLESYFAE